MIAWETSIPGVHRLRAERHEDARGSFERIFCRATLEEAGLPAVTVAQASISRTVRARTIRGLHLQVSPHEETKLVTCLAGRVYDVVADLRPWSPTYLRWEAHVLEPSDGALFVPPGVAHGFQTLTHGVELLYAITAAYAPDAATGARFDDPALGIAWPLPVGDISDRDLTFPPLAPARLEAS